MSPVVATTLCILFILWLFAEDAKDRRNISRALWIPLGWAFVLGSKPLSLWFQGAGALDPDQAGLEDTVLDKTFLFSLLLLASLVLMARGRNWSVLFRSNKWLVVYFLYLGISILWSQTSFIALKRWIKDLGNILMVMIPLTESHPVEAFRALLARTSYLLIPLSVLAIKYYPGMSRGYDRWTGEVSFVGITTDKNILGITLFVCALSLSWMALELRNAAPRKNYKTALLRYTVLMLMTGWLLIKASSSTALTCALVGICILLGLQNRVLRQKLRYLEAYAVGLLLLVLLLQLTGAWQSITGAFAKAVGRDASFHGRTAIWTALLKEPVNPLIGVGYYSFWSPERAERISQKYFYTLNEAHNGYLETYLNSGLVGLILLLGVLGSAARWIKKDALARAPLAELRLAFLVSAILYSVTEAIFNRLSLIWFVLLLMIVRFPSRTKTVFKGSLAGKAQSAGERVPVLDTSTGPRLPQKA